MSRTTAPRLPNAASTEAAAPVGIASPFAQPRHNNMRKGWCGGAQCATCSRVSSSSVVVDEARLLLWCDPVA